MHYILWANQDQVQHEQETIEMVEWLTQQGFRLLNIPGEAIYLDYSRNGYTSVLDLTFANRPATQSGCPSEWAINQEIAYGSDYYTIQ